MSAGARHATTAEAWCEAYVTAADVGTKLAPPPRPAFAESPPAPRRLEAPGRAPELDVRDRAEKIPRPAALAQASARAKLLHVFLHHEVQAAELCAWAFLAYPDAPREFREGLMRVLDDEVRHASAYAERMAALGTRYGDFPVRDWFWQRTLQTTTPLQYVALMGLGFEGGNLEHATRFEEILREHGDDESAKLLELVGREEVAHVRFAARWFCEWTGADPGDGPDFERWRAELPEPLTPAVLRGDPIDRERRTRAGLSASFLDRLEAFEPRSTTRKR